MGDVHFTIRQAQEEDLTGLVGAIRRAIGSGEYITAETVAGVVDNEGVLIRHNELESRIFFIRTRRDEQHRTRPAGTDGSGSRGATESGSDQITGERRVRHPGSGSSEVSHADVGRVRSGPDPCRTARRAVRQPARTHVDTPSSSRNHSVV